MTNSTIYLDHSNNGRPSRIAIQSMMAILTDKWASPLSPHQFGQSTLISIEDSLRQIYRHLGAKEEATILITSSGAEAVSSVVQSVYRNTTRTTGKNHFLVGSTDEAASILALEQLEPYGCITKSVKTNAKGSIDVDAVADALTPRTALLSLSAANGLTGVVHSLQEIRELCQSRGVLFHVDVSHLIGKSFFDMKELNPDFLTLNGSQIHAPQGSGLLYIKEKTDFTPLILGGNEQDKLRGGDYSAALAGLGTALEESMETLDLLCTEVARLKSRLEQGILAGTSNAKVFFDTEERLPHVTAIAFPDVINEALLYALNQRGLFATMGGNRLQQISMNLISCQIEESLAETALSFSLSRYTTAEEIERAIAIISQEYTKLQSLSHYIRS